MGAASGREVRPRVLVVRRDVRAGADEDADGASADAAIGASGAVVMDIAGCGGGASRASCDSNGKIGASEACRASRAAVW